MIHLGTLLKLPPGCKDGHSEHVYHAFITSDHYIQQLLHSHIWDLTQVVILYELL